jgi:hypothetical protein
MTQKPYLIRSFNYADDAEQFVNDHVPEYVIDRIAYDNKKVLVVLRNRYIVD